MKKIILLTFYFLITINFNLFVFASNFDDNSLLDTYDELEKRNLNVENDLFSYTEGDLIYYSSLSEDHAWYNAMIEKYNSDSITEDEIIYQYNEFSRRDFVGEYMTSSKSNNENKLCININLLFENYHGGTTYIDLPLKNIRIEIYEKDLIVDDLLYSSYSDENGFVNFEIENVGDIYDDDFCIYAKVYAESYTFKMTRDWDLLFLTDYYVVFDVCNNLNDNNINITQKIRYDIGNRVNCAFIASQGLELGQRFALEMGMNTTQKLKVLFPICISNITSFCYDTYAGIVVDDFNDYDAIIHEYGHYLSHVYNAYGSSLFEIALNNPQHYIMADHFSCGNHLTNKFALELAWSEAWATTFSEIVQTKYNSEYLTIIEGFGDCKFYNTNTARYETLESFIYDNNSCEAQEIVIASFLWDLFDNNTTTNSTYEIYDNISNDYEQWWYKTLSDGIYTLNDFFDYIELYYVNDLENISKLLSSHHISAYSISVSNVDTLSEITKPILEWYPGGSNYSLNTKFQIVFLGPNYYPLYESNFIYSSTNSKIIANNFISQEQWTNFINRFDHDFTFYITIKSYNENNPNNGYYSEIICIDFKLEEHVCGYTHSYQQYDNSKHKSICSCGNYLLQLHVVKPTGMQRYKPCMYCGYMIDTENTIIGVNPFNRSIINAFDIFSIKKKDDYYA